AEHGPGLGHGTFAPLGGAGAPRRAAKYLPVEHDGGTHFVPIDDIVAVHANAHYTYIFDGKVQLFCPLAIGVLESRLDANRFLRVHRSHIVNIDHVMGLKRSGDTGMLRLSGVEPHMVPVSRSRLSRLKSRLDLKSGGAAAGRDRAASTPTPGFAAQQR